jgi:hypothetical protein
MRRCLCVESRSHDCCGRRKYQFSRLVQPVCKDRSGSCHGRRLIKPGDSYSESRINSYCITLHAGPVLLRFGANRQMSVPAGKHRITASLVSCKGSRSSILGPGTRGCVGQWEQEHEFLHTPYLCQNGKREAYQVLIWPLSGLVRQARRFSLLTGHNGKPSPSTCPTFWRLDIPHHSLCLLGR